jgi:chorismate mutase
VSDGVGDDGSASAVIDALRGEIDAIDAAIAEALLARRKVVAALLAEKRARGIELLDPARESVIAARYQAALGDVEPAKVRALVDAVLGASRA